AQLGPIHLADTRGAVLKRLMAMLREAHAGGAKFVVFPELALTTFFPRYWMTDQDEIDSFFEREMPGPETRPLFDLARELGVGFYLGYAELTQEKGELHGYNTPTENIHHPEPMHLRMFHHLVTMQANAYQNGTWVLAAAKAGKEDGFGLIGGSAIIAPTGEIAARALGEDDEVITATLDLD